MAGFSMLKVFKKRFEIGHRDIDVTGMGLERNHAIGTCEDEKSTLSMCRQLE